MLAGWPTPTAQDADEHGGRRASDQRHAIPLNALAGWATPRPQDSEQTGARLGTLGIAVSQTRLAGCGTPTAQDGDAAQRNRAGRRWGATADNRRARARGADAVLLPCLDGKARRIGAAHFVAWMHGYPPIVVATCAEWEAMVPLPASGTWTAWRSSGR